MARLVRLVCGVLTLSIASVSLAQSPSAPSSTQARRPRTLSSDLARKLMNQMPRYNPQQAAPEAVTDNPVVATPGPIPDEPRNGIVRLPRYIVEGNRPPILHERDFYTPEGLRELAIRRHLGRTGRALNSFPPGAAAAVAMFMYEENERLQKMAAMRETVSALQSADASPVNDRLRRDVENTFMRGYDWRHRTGK